MAVLKMEIITQDLQHGNCISVEWQAYIYRISGKILLECISSVVSECFNQESGEIPTFSEKYKTERLSSHRSRKEICFLSGKVHCNCHVKDDGRSHAE